MWPFLIAGVQWKHTVGSLTIHLNTNLATGKKITVKSLKMTLRKTRNEETFLQPTEASTLSEQ